MAKFSGQVKEDDQLELPPGFRFHPTDEELITHYLTKKVLDHSFFAVAIGEVDMNKVEPWDLPRKAKMGEKEWYFFCVRDKKYPTGLRTNRATAAGYWKATGKDREIFRGKALVGMKKTLVFYNGRAPKGEKSNWVSHEYRLEGRLAHQNLSKTSKNEWVISRVFQKSSGGMKVHISGQMGFNSIGNEYVSSPVMPPLMDSPSSGHVHCFSNSVTSQENGIHRSNVPHFPYSSPNLADISARGPVQNAGFLNQFSSFQGNPEACGPFALQTFLETCVRNTNPVASLSQETGQCTKTETSSVLSSLEMQSTAFEAPQDLDCLWGY